MALTIGGMYRFTQICMVLGFVVALAGLWYRNVSPLLTFYGLGMLAAGAFALWGIRRVRG